VHVEVVVVLAILVFGCAAFLLGMIYLVCQAFGLVWRGVVGLVQPARKGRPRGRTVWICPSERCRRVEHRDARFCSQCGTRLVAADDGMDRSTG